MAKVEQLLEIMARLRDPETGCPWDLEQDFASIAPYTIEEAYEVDDAIRRGDPEALRDELGDLLLQVVYHARMAEESGSFAFAEVVEAICEKMVRRHPHVFGDAEVADSAAQSREWEAHKAAERAARGRETPGTLAGLPLGLPALLRAGKLLRRAARVGFDWPDDAGALAQLEEELGELREELEGERDAERLGHEVGDLLFAVSALARRLGVEPETALRNANQRFELRFAAMERALAERGREAGGTRASEWLRLWRESPSGPGAPGEGGD